MLKVYKRNNDGYSTLYSGFIASQIKKDINRLAVIGSGNELHIYVNDVPLKVVKDNELRNGISGVIGIGIGRYCFDNFAIYEMIDKLPK